ncbi:MAG: ABC transporter ATP-binding protein, partial [Planctomycetota bacterium]
TTLLSIIGGLERPDGGRLLVDGRDLGGLTRRELAQYRREQVGFVFQFFNLLPTLDARENVAMGLVPQGRSRRDRRRRADEALARVGLGGKAERLPHQLSGGEQQRVAVARAWAKEPALLLADEPTGNLDDAAGARVLDLLLGPEGAGAGRTVLVATHDGAIAARVSRVLTLEAHHVVET